MIKLKINNTDLKICESTAQVIVLNPDESTIEEIVSLLTERNYTCAAIYPFSSAAEKLSSQIGGMVTSNYDIISSTVSQFI